MYHTHSARAYAFLWWESSKCSLLAHHCNVAKEIEKSQHIL